MRNQLIGGVIIVLLSHLAIAQTPRPTAPPPAPPPTEQNAQAPAQPAPTPMPPGVVTRVYNISDLIQPTMSYPFQTIVIPPVQLGARQQEPSLVSNLPNQIQAAVQPSAVTAEGITKLIADVVAPESWREAGGQDGSLRVLDRLLIVTQTPDNQAKVTELLDQLRHESGPGRTITVKADWILLNADELKRVTVRRAKSNEVPEVSLDEVEALKPKAHYRGQLSCFNGQTVHIASVRGRTVINKLDPVVAQNAVGYSADVTMAQAGATLQVTPQVAPDASSATVDVQSLVTEFADPSEITHDTQPTTRRSDAGNVVYSVTRGEEVAGGGPWSLIDRQNISVQQLRTTLRMPLGKPILVGGMTVGPNLKSAEEGQLYLVIEVTASDGAVK